MNLNDLAVEVAKKEGKKVQMNIGQIKEVMKITLQKLAINTPEDVEKVLRRYRNKK